MNDSRYTPLPPLPPIVNPAKPSNRPPRLYRNSPDVIPEDRDNNRLDETQDEQQVADKISVVMPDKEPVKVGPEIGMNRCQCKPLPPPPPLPPLPPPPPPPPLPPPLPPPPVNPPKPCNCPPREYRNPPDVELIAGRNIDLQVDKDDVVWKYTVSSEADKINVLPGDHIAVRRKTTDVGADFTIDAVQFPVKIDGDSSDALYGDGTPDNPIGIYDFVGATAQDDGKPGAVPAPAKGDRNYYLKGDGKWSPIEFPEQVQSDWNEKSTASPAYILNKPDIDAMVLGATTEVIAGDNTQVVHTEDPTDHHNVYTISADAKPQVQADWNQTDEKAVDYIKNKPDLDADVTSSDGTNVQVGVTQTAGKITGVSIVTDNTVGRGDGAFTEGNIPAFDENGNIVDSGLSVESSIQGITDADGTEFDITDNIACIPTAVAGSVIDPETKETQSGNLGLVTIATIEL